MKIIIRIYAIAISSIKLNVKRLCYSPSHTRVVIALRSLRDQEAIEDRSRGKKFPGGLREIAQRLIGPNQSQRCFAQNSSRLGICTIRLFGPVLFGTCIYVLVVEINPFPKLVVIFPDYALRTVWYMHFGFLRK